MTGAWAFLYNRRYRASRKPEVRTEAGPFSPPDRDKRRYRHRHRHADRDPRALRSECEAVQSGRTTNESGTGNSNSGGAASSGGNSWRIISSNQLPGDVLQARTRLLERLRGRSLSESREAPIDSGISWEHFVVSDDCVINYSRDREAETERQWLDTSVADVGFAAQTDRTPSFYDSSQANTLPLGWEAHYHIQREVFRNPEESDGITRGSLECCICLERFQEGDQLIRLHCSHRFHPLCLESWMRTTSNCPYCRTSVNVNYGGGEVQSLHCVFIEC